MERLTFEGLFCDIAKCDSTPGGTFCETGTCTQRRVWERLKEYEDTGLEPEEIADFMKRWERAVEIAGLCKNGGIDHLLELKKAEQDGQLVVLPFKKGSTLLDYSDPERPELLCNFRIAVAYDHRGIVFHQPFNIFMENVKRGYISQLSKEAEAALAQEGDSEQ